ncbi:glycosyltransferase [Alteromonas sp. 345S023]|uniref:Glycosyltransferase n=1 Tax=Alteromonas profundi TaxID=2696062 RepID=A0A7X5LLS2_9ALTE|nr:glycosyltransferase family 4 protein [Alteromonas profundi]NDV91692.1 glycosyltransferase [Alteromonas profundi]
MTNLPSEVVVFCPLPPKPNGIADYFAEQIPLFLRTTQVTVVIENTHPEPINISPRVNILRLEEYMWQQKAYANMPHIYHVGNNPDTQYMLEVLLSKPGLVVVHDLNLHYLIDLTNLSQGDKDGYTLALANNYGEAGSAIGKQLTKFGWKGKFMPHELMMNASIISAAERILVHSEYSANKIGALGHPNISVVPHHFSPAARKFQAKLKMQYRGELGVPGNKPVITSMGFIAKAKQIKAVLRALSELKQQGLDFTYVLAGQCKPHEYDVFQDIAEHGLTDNVIVTGFLDEDAFFKYMLSSDFIVNLRYPTGGESSGTLTRAMGMGLCCVVVNIGPFAELPEHCAVKLDWNDDFDSNLLSQLSRLISDQQYRATIGMNAKKWVEKTHSIATTTKAYLEEAGKLTDTTTFESRALNNQVETYLTEASIRQWQLENAPSNENNNLWWQANLLPLSAPSVLVVTNEAQATTEVLSALYGYSQKQLSVLSASALCEPSENGEQVAAAAVNIDIHALANDPVKWLCQLNTRLALGATAIVSLAISGIEPSMHALDRASMQSYMEAAGFSVEKTVAGPLDIDMNMKAEQHNEQWVFALTKRSWMANINPPAYNNGVSELKWLVTHLEAGS